MQNYYGNPVARLIEEFATLPGVGQKSAQRMAFYVLNAPVEKAQALADAILDAKDRAKYCAKCYNLTDAETCYICANGTRDAATIMIVESPQDMAA
jgi:recombination protein RecR